MDLLSFPSELLIHIFLYLDFHDAFNLQATHPSFLTLYQRCPELQYVLDCQIAGVDSNPRCQLPIQTRIRMLRDRQLAWKSLEPTFTEDFEMPVRPSGHYDITRSHLILGTLTPGSPIRTVDGAQSLNITRRAGVRYSNISIENLVDFGCCIDEHDLFVCVTK